MKVDWSQHTPEEIWEALKTAPKIAGPWQGTPGGYLNFRVDPFMDFVVSAEYDGLRVAALNFWTPQGREYVDARLREAGWILLPQEPPKEMPDERPVAWTRLDQVD